MICRRELLLEACQAVAGVVPTRTTMPIYTKIKLLVEQDKYVLMGTDLEIGVRYEVKDDPMYDAASVGECVLDPDKLIPILRESTHNLAEVMLSDRGAKVYVGPVNYDLLTEDAAGFSDVEPFATDEMYDSTAGEFHKLIRRTLFAAAREEGKYAMCSVNIDLSDGVLRLVATDGKRLAVASGGPLTANEHKTALVPTKAMKLVDHVLGSEKKDLPIKFGFNGSKAVFVANGATITTRLVEGMFPKWRDVLPKTFKHHAKSLTENFYQAVRQATIMTDDESKRVEFSFTEDKVTLTAQGVTSGKANVSLILDYQDPPLNINFDPAYILDMLRVIDERKLKMAMVNTAAPAVFTDEENTYQYLVVPMV